MAHMVSFLAGIFLDAIVMKQLSSIYIYNRFDHFIELKDNVWVQVEKRHLGDHLPALVSDVLHWPNVRVLALKGTFVA